MRFGFIPEEKNDFNELPVSLDFSNSLDFTSYRFEFK
jgi:hypothetical protein